MDPKQPVSSPFSGIKPQSSSPEGKTPAQSSPESCTPDDDVFSSLFSYSSSMSVPIQQGSASSTGTDSLPSTPSSTWSSVSSPPNHMEHYTIPALAMDIPSPVPTPGSPPRTQSGKRTKIPRPPNAFMLFRSYLIHSDKLPSEVGRRQQDVSRIAGRAWNMLKDIEKDVWRMAAVRRLREHERRHPNYKFEPSFKGRQTVIEKIRKAADDSDDDTARRLKALSDVYARDRRAAKSARPRRPRKRASPYKPPARERTPQTPVRGHHTPQLMAGSQLGSPSVPSLITFDSPSSSSSAQSLSPLPVYTQPYAFGQGMPQQPLPYMFLPPGLPNHFEQAHQQENGTIVFADNYAPINPFSPPPGYYAFDHARMGPVVDNVGMATGTAPNTTATMLGLYELNSPYAHYNPNLCAGWNGSPVYQPPVQASPIYPTTNTYPSPLSTSPLTPREQQVFNAVISDSQLPLSLEGLVPFPLSIYGDGFTPGAESVANSPSPAAWSSPSPFSTYTLPEELSFAKPQTQTSKTKGSASKIPRSPAADRFA